MLFRSRRDHHYYVIGEAISPISKFQQIIDAWDGIATISVDVEDGEFSDATLLKVAEVIEELVSNAIRHGGATEISVRVALEDGSNRVNFFDNGKKRVKGKPGLGSSLLKSLTKNVVIQESDGGTRISFGLIE